MIEDKTDAKVVNLPRRKPRLVKAEAPEAAPTPPVSETPARVIKGTSVVKPLYRARYREREGSMGGRNNADWLALTLANLVLDERKNLKVSELERIAELNGVSAEYQNRSPGWQGRMRMTIGLRLRAVVAQQGGLLVPSTDKRSKGKPAKIPAPEAFVAANKR